MVVIKKILDLVICQKQSVTLNKNLIFLKMTNATEILQNEFPEHFGLPDDTPPYGRSYAGHPIHIETDYGYQPTMRWRFIVNNVQKYEFREIDELVMFLNKNLPHVHWTTNKVYEISSGRVSKVIEKALLGCKIQRIRNDIIS